MTLTATAHPIVRKKRRWFPEMPVSLDNFVLGEGSAFDAQRLLHSPQLSLYCADIKSGRMVFVETPPGRDLTAAPFYYLAQYEQALRVITLSFGDFIALTDALPPPGKQFIFLYTVGRAGSTLLTKIFAGDPGTVSISEPDVLADLTLLARAGQAQKQQAGQLLFSCFKLFSASPAAAGRPRILIKPRGYCIEMGEMIHGALPGAKGIFLYRNAVPVIESFIRAFSIAGPLSLLRDTVPSRLLLRYLVARFRPMLLACFPALSRYTPAELYRSGWTGLLCITWLSIMNAYVRLHRAGLDVRALRYEDILKNPQELVARLFAYCGIPEACLAEALKALGRDSQEGTRLARSVAHTKHWQVKAINPEHVRLILQGQPEINTPDYIAPGTLMHDSAAG